jgi:hypothetical protein
MTINILDPNSYTSPDTTYEDYTEEVTATNVRKGDRIGGPASTAVVATTVVGRKYVTAFNGNEDQILRVELDEKVTVTRRKIDQATRDADRQYIKNIGVCKLYAGTNYRLPRAMEKLNDDVKAYRFNGVDYQRLGAVIEAAAMDRVYEDFKQAMEYLAKREEDRPVNAAAAWDLWYDEQVKWMLTPHRHRAISNSTNVISNLIEHAQVEAVAKFLDLGKWW